MRDIIAKTFVRTKNVELFLGLEGAASVRVATKNSRVSHPWGQHLVWMWRKEGLINRVKQQGNRSKYVYTAAGKELERVLRQIR